MGTGFSGRQLRSGQKRGAGVGKTKKGKGTKWMLVTDGNGLPIGFHLDSASPAEVKLTELTLQSVRVQSRKGQIKRRPRKLVADRAYDSCAFRQPCLSTEFEKTRHQSLYPNAPPPQELAQETRQACHSGPPNLQATIQGRAQL
jgi:hypothetical protein